MRIESDILKTAGVLAVLSVTFVVVVWMPHRSAMGDLQKQIEARRQAEQAQMNEAKNFEKLQKNVKSLEKEFTALGKTIPSSTDVSPFLAQLGRELADVSLTDSEIQSETVLHGSDTSVIPMTLRIRGSYDQFFDFLRAVESGNRLTRVSDVKITGTPLKKDEPLNIRVELATFATSGGQASR